MIEYLGLWLLIAMTLNMWGLTCALQSGESLTKLLIWAIVLLVPALGFPAWFLLGPRVKRAS